MELTVPGIEYVVSVLAIGYCTNSVISLLKSTPLTELYFVLCGSTDMAARVVQSLNALSPMVMTEAGMFTDVREEQELNADLPIVVTVSPISIDLIYFLYENQGELIGLV